MHGTFTYSNKPLVTAAALSGCILTGCVMTLHPLIGLILLILTVVLVLLLTHISGHYTADQTSVTIRLLWRKQRLDYREIQSVKTETRHLGNSRWDDTVQIEAELNIRTEHGVYVFCSRHSISVTDQLQAPEAFKSRIDDLDFIKLGRYIESQL